MGIMQRHVARSAKHGEIRRSEKHVLRARTVRVDQVVNNKISAVSLRATMCACGMGFDPRGSKFAPSERLPPARNFPIASDCGCRCLGFSRLTAALGRAKTRSGFARRASTYRAVDPVVRDKELTVANLAVYLNERGRFICCIRHFDIHSVSSKLPLCKTFSIAKTLSRSSHNSTTLFTVLHGNTSEIHSVRMKKEGKQNESV